jgi:hypothetical protein
MSATGNCFEMLREASPKSKQATQQERQHCQTFLMGTGKKKVPEIRKCREPSVMWYGAGVWSTSVGQKGKF